MNGENSLMNESVGIYTWKNDTCIAHLLRHFHPVDKAWVCNYLFVDTQRLKPQRELACSSLDEAWRLVCDRVVAFSGKGR